MVVVSALLAGTAHAQTTGIPLTLAAARQRALATHPRIAAARLRAEAAAQVVNEARAPLFPSVTASATGVEAADGTAIAAGALATSSLSDRFATGVVASQLITDFGRTRHLTASASFAATAQQQRLEDTRSAVLLEVSRAYYEALSADAVLSVARTDLDTKQLLARQVSALARSELKSTLDVSFADVAVSEAELALSRADSAVSAARARLAAAIGDSGTITYQLTDEALPPNLSPDPQTDIDEAARLRPALAALKASRDAARQFATAEQRLAWPSANVLAAAGVLPSHDARLQDSYSAAGINVSVPVFTGGLLLARRTEASLRADAASKDVDDLTMTVGRDVRIAWLQAADAFKRLDVTARLVEQANTALRLARVRYDAGLTSIVELTQAQFSQTSAQIEAAQAKYEYLDRRALLDYVVGRTQ